MWAVVCVLQTAGECSRAPTLSAGPQTIEASNAKASTSAIKTSSPLCPAAGSPMLLHSAPGVGHHRVVLSWSGAAPSPRPQDSAVGYCLYRSTKKHAAEKNATCPDCEQVNGIPMTAVGCVDDVVKDGTTYYYVVAAINPEGQLSLPSKEIVAAIPAGRGNLNSDPAGAFSMCRAPVSLK
jgi:hypothetical protein